jgi:short-subunit dehydrogenase
VKLAGRSVLVTGATGGLGREIARVVAARGARVVVSGRRAGELEELAEALGGRAVVADLASRDDVERLAREAGDADVLVANAALPADGLVAEYSVEQIDRALDVNLRAPIVLARLLMEGMVGRGEGHMVFVSSMSGKVATHRTALYSATKFGLRAFAAGMRQDLRASGVGVSVVFPTNIDEAGMFAESGAKLPRLAGSRKPRHVAAAVVRAVEANRAEIDVAPLGARLWGRFGGLAPVTLEHVNRALGAERFAEAISGSEAHRAKR